MFKETLQLCNVRVKNCKFLERGGLPLWRFGQEILYTGTQIMAPSLSFSRAKYTCQLRRYPLGLGGDIDGNKVTSRHTNLLPWPSFAIAANHQPPSDYNHRESNRFRSKHESFSKISGRGKYRVHRCQNKRRVGLQDSWSVPYLKRKNCTAVSDVSMHYVALDGQNSIAFLCNFPAAIP